MLTRKRAKPGSPKEMSHAPCSRRVVIACLLSPIRSAAMWRVSSGVREVSPGTCTGIIWPYTWTCGGRPGEKIRSLIFSEARSIAPRSAGGATLPLPEKPSNATEIGAMDGDAIRPHDLRNRMHHRNGSNSDSSLYQAGVQARRDSKYIALGNLRGDSKAQGRLL